MKKGIDGITIKKNDWIKSAIAIYLIKSMERVKFESFCTLKISQALAVKDNVQAM